jgi:hypothetical protein
LWTEVGVLTTKNAKDTKVGGAAFCRPERWSGFLENIPELQPMRAAADGAGGFLFVSFRVFGGPIPENRVCGAFYAAKSLASVQNGGKTLAQMFYQKYYPQTSVSYALKAEMSDGVAARPDGVGPQGCRDGRLAIMISGPVHPRLCGIKGAGDAVGSDSIRALGL